MANAPEPKMRGCRFIVDPPRRGSWNMALDEALLESAAREGMSTIRFYQWSQPTLSLGYFQPHEARRSHAASRDSLLVRRSTGGGAILHDRELTYSMTLPAKPTDRGHLSWLYYAWHETLIDTLASLGVAARLQPRDQSATADEPFLCFQRRTRGDVLVDSDEAGSRSHKIAGSAQRRRQGAVLQHGSVLLGVSDSAAELPGIVDLSGQAIDAATLVSGWKPRLRDRLHMKLKTTPLANKEIDLARRIEAEKFAHPEWTDRR